MDAVKDLSTAHEVDPGSAEIAKQLAAARARYEAGTYTRSLLSST